ncbi:MAG: 6-hydroxycyclohex-1-ene-1-carbonyl-CoA dehydrogenase [Polyangiaceae bacterium]
MAIESEAYFLETAGTPLQRRALLLPTPEPTDAIVEVAACGLCHTDLGFARGQVAPRHELPLVLGHEIVGTVVETGSAVTQWQGKRVLVPAVMPCGECAFCRAGRGNACPSQKMPGNDIHGGFARHVVVPARSIVSLEDAPASVNIDALSVVADAVSTAYQAVLRADVKSGDVVFVVGGGGVGGYVTQIAKALGAHVVVCDVQPERLQGLPADHKVGVANREPRDVRKELFGYAKQWGVPSLRWRVFECSGAAPGQTLAYTLLSQAATLLVVGFTRDSIPLRLSNLMAFDATVHGSWGCPVEAYADVLNLIYEGRVQIEPYVERGPMSQLNEYLSALEAHRLEKRMVMNPAQ